MVLIREMLFADDATLTAHTKEALKRLISSFARNSDEFGLTISLKKSSFMGQDVISTPCISIGHHTLKTVEDFTYLGSTISQQPLSGQRAEHQNQQGINSDGPPDQESVEQQHAYHQHRDESVSG